jgi:hypothetical protein
MKDRWQLSMMVVGVTSVLLTACSLGSIGASSSSPAAIRSAGSTPTPSGSPLPSGTYANAKAAGIAGVVAGSGYPYSEGPTPGTSPYLTAAILNEEFPATVNPPVGVNAYMVLLTVMNSGALTRCYAYVYFDSPGWRSMAPVACRQAVGYYPLPGQNDHVVVPQGTCANVRQGPGLIEHVVSCLTAGTIVKVDYPPPHYADGHIWWSINSQQGWMAHDFLITP